MPATRWNGLGSTPCLVWKDENVRFLSGLRPQIIQGKSALLNGCLLRRDGKMTLFLSAARSTGSD